jgi:hypothetical protein
VPPVSFGFGFGLTTYSWPVHVSSQ